MLYWKDMVNPERIDIGWPDPGYVPGIFATSIAATVRDMEYFGCMGKIHRMEGSILTAVRNKIVRTFLEESDSEWLWMVDSDMVFDKGHPMRLWTTACDEGVKMVSGLAFIWKDGRQPVPSVFYHNPDEPDMLGFISNRIPEGPTVVPATGLASSLVHREVFEAMEGPRDEKYRWFDIIHLPSKANEGLSGEDVQFFVRAKELGYDLVLDPSAETWHMKEIGVGRADFDRFWELHDKD